MVGVTAMLHKRRKQQLKHSTWISKSCNTLAATQQLLLLVLKTCWLPATLLSSST
jgi:hypothetical protein